jgi:cyclase
VIRTRLIPCLLLRHLGLVKTVRFKDAKYIGDPINAVKIFNDKEVDELVFLDITATASERSPNMELLARIATEAFMPFSYGGGIKTVEQATAILRMGAEKVSINTAAFENPRLVEEIASKSGSQSVIVSVDARRIGLKRYEVFIKNGSTPTGVDPVRYSIEMEKRGAGEILLTSIDGDGTGAGYDTDLIRAVSAAVGIPVIACGGAGALVHVPPAVDAGAAAVAAGSMFVFVGPHRAVLINYPTRQEIDEVMRYGEQRP